MEPLFFKAENAALEALLGEPLPASMEPLFFKAENDTLVTRPWVVRLGFNGAAFFQSGKSFQFVSTRAISLSSFNGAAFFQSGK